MSQPDMQSASKKSLKVERSNHQRAEHGKMQNNPLKLHQLISLMQMQMQRKKTRLALTKKWILLNKTMRILRQEGGCPCSTHQRC
ncbi:hypothetical protein BS78_05G128400 [Paspalum vaginatum]|nr:hypothetical protein BS78_05G128400 [Paspalum vaginatum]